MEGVTIELIDEDGNVVATTTTGPDGTYEFLDVLPGDYTITESNPVGYESVSDSDGGDPDVVEVTVDNGDVSGVDFVDTPTSTISGIVDSDNDGDGTPDDVLAGVTIELLDPEGNVIATTTTEPDGSSEFTGITPGEYTIQETDPDGHGSITNSSCVAGGSTSLSAIGGDPSCAEPNLIPVIVAGGIDVAGQTFTDAPTSTISGTVEVDTNGDGAPDQAVAGVTIQLVDANGNVVAETTTDANGDYSFANVIAGEYTIVEADADGHSSVRDSDGGDPNVISVTVANGVAVADVDFIDALRSIAAPPPALAFTGRSILTTVALALLLVLVGAVFVRSGRTEEQSVS